MSYPGVTIITVQNPIEYSQAQIDKACALALALQRGKFVLLEPPEEDDEAQ